MRRIVLTLVAALVSPEKPLPFLEAAGRPLRGSLSENIVVAINGTRSFEGLSVDGRQTVSAGFIGISAAGCTPCGGLRQRR